MKVTPVAQNQQSIPAVDFKQSPTKDEFRLDAVKQHKQTDISVLSSRTNVIESLREFENKHSAKVPLNETGGMCLCSKRVGLKQATKKGRAGSMKLNDGAYVRKAIVALFFLPALIKQSMVAAEETEITDYNSLYEHGMVSSTVERKTPSYSARNNSTITDLSSGAGILSEDEIRLLENLDPLPPMSAGNEIDLQCGVDKSTVLDQARRFRAVELDPRYNCEQYGHVFKTSVKYLSDEELASHRVVIRAGKLFDSTAENLLNAPDQGWRKPIFIMDRNGAFYLEEEPSVGFFHHSSFKSSQSVAAAGEMVVEDGVIKEITNVSGHYKPSEDIMRQALCELERRGVEVSEEIFTTARMKDSNPPSCEKLVALAIKENKELKHPNRDLKCEKPKTTWWDLLAAIVFGR